MTVDSERFMDDLEFGDGTEHFGFNNNEQDDSRVRTCLTYAVYERAGTDR
jgi:hypothetical protein